MAEVAPFFLWQRFCEVAHEACGEEHERPAEVGLGSPTEVEAGSPAPSRLT